MPSNNLHHSPPTTHHSPLEQLRSIMARLRDPQGGCPWDLEQNFATIAPYTIEEAYEVADAIARGDMGELKDELGDLLLQVVFHSQMAAEAGLFTFDDVAQSVSDKMIRRHPHVFADADIKTAEAQTASWESIKAAERSAKLEAARPHPEFSQGKIQASPEGEVSQASPPNHEPCRNITSPLGEVEKPLGFSGEGVPTPNVPRTLADIPLALPALMRAQKLQSRAARVGFDWPEVSGVIAKIREELLEVEQAMLAEDSAAVADELGDLLFAVTNLARFTGHDAESALRGTNAKFTRRFEYIEDQLRAAGKTPGDSTLNEMGALWDAVKKLEKENA
ncbi:MAG: nucleoside triphosphate pyrophosphohydrolase [Rickettsiales bacterium]